ncbi:MAG: hypothetical protein ACYS8W_11500 [Planctomycetota bacterium]|jgi:hypothetical protein
MRIGFFRVIVIAILLASSAAAEEVVLERTDLKNPMFPRGRDIRCTVLKEAPEGAEAPEGEMTLADLRLGKNNILVCILKESEQACKIYVDLDMDCNLKEETPVSGKSTKGGNYTRTVFDLKEIPGLFKAGDSDIPIDMSLRIMLTSYTYQNRPVTSVQMYVFTVFQADVKAFDRDWKLTWVPGQDPMLQSAGVSTYNGGFHVGRKRISFPEDCLVLKEEKLTCRYEVAEDETLKPVTVPDGLTTLTTMKKVKNLRITCLPDNGKVYLEEGDYYNTRFTIEKTIESDKWRLQITRSAELKVGDNSAVSDIEPLVFDVEPQYRDKGGILLKPVLRDKAGECSRILLYKNNRMFPTPDIVVKDSEGREVLRTTLKLR